MAGNARAPGQSVTSKFVAIVLVFTQGSEHSLAQIAAATGLPLSTTHRLVHDLTVRRILRRTADGSFRAGPLLHRLDHAGAATPSIRERGPFVIGDLAEVTGCRSRLGVLDDSKVRYLEKSPGPTPVSDFSPAATLPIHATALGRALIAYSPPGAIELVALNGLYPYTPQTAATPTRLRRALALVRATGVSIAHDELQIGVTGVAVPVFDRPRHPIAALELLAPTGADLAPLKAALTMASTCLSRELLPFTRLTATPESATVRRYA